MSVICKKCCSMGSYGGGRPDPKEGDPCSCGGVLERAPEWHELVDILPEEMRCGRRNDPFSMSHVFPGPDHWEKFKAPHGNRVCSYCGSLHWEDMLALVKQSAEASEDADYHQTVQIEPSDKGYKVYVNQPGVRNAHEGGIKFYMQHVPRKECSECQGSRVRVYPGTPLGGTETCKLCNGVGTIVDVNDEQNSQYAEAIRRSRIRFNKYLNQRYPV